MRRHPLRAVRTVLIGTAAAVLLSGCYKADIQITVDDDGSGTLDVVAAINPDAFLEALGPLAGMFSDESESVGDFSREAMCADGLSDMAAAGPGVTVEPYDDGTFCGERRIVGFAAGDDLNEVMQRAVPDDADSGTMADGEVTLERTDDGGWRFEMTGIDLDIDGMSSDEEMGDFVDPAMMEALMGEAEYRISVRLPGRPVDSNANSIDGNTFVWDLEIGQSLDRLTAVTEPGVPDGGGSNTWIWVVIGVVVVAAAAAVVVLVKRRGGDGGGSTDDTTGDTRGSSEWPPAPPSLQPIEPDADATAPAPPTAAPAPAPPGRSPWAPPQV